MSKRICPICKKEITFLFATCKVCKEDVCSGCYHPDEGKKSARGKTCLKCDKDRYIGGEI